MKRVCMLMVAALLLLAVATGCQDESKPTFTRIRVTPECGVAPMNVEGYAILSGGNETGDPLGGNNNLDIKWSFGDGGTGSTSIAYHTYYPPEDSSVTVVEYTVTVVGTDPDGNTASTTFPVTVLADSLIVEAESNFPVDDSGIAQITTTDTVRFDITEISSCDIGFPTVPGDSVKVEIQWAMIDPDTTFFDNIQPEFVFDTPGLHEAILTVFYPGWAVVRKQTLTFNVAP